MTEIRNVEAELMRFRIRLAVVGLAVLLAFGLLGWRLYHLQVLRHDELARQAESNRTAVMPVVPHRGEITDRKHRHLIWSDAAMGPARARILAHCRAVAVPAPAL